MAPDTTGDAPKPEGGTKPNHQRLAPVVLFIIGIVFIAIGIFLVFDRSGVGTSQVITTGTAPHTTVTTIPGHTALGSDVVDSFFLGAGAILVLTGAFYSRISKIGLPGGGSIELTPVAQAKVAAAIGAKLSDPDKIAAAYAKTTKTLADQYWGAPMTPSGVSIASAVDLALAGLTEGESPPASAS
jgi:hypothetical protein